MLGLSHALVRLCAHGLAPAPALGGNHFRQKSTFIPAIIAHSGARA